EWRMVDSIAMVPSLRRVLGLIAIGSSLGCNVLITDWQTTGGGGQRQNLLFEADFEGSEPFAGFEPDFQACCSDSVTQSSEQHPSGGHSARIIQRPGDDLVSNGYRSEIITKGDFDTGERWYGMSIFFDTPRSGADWTGSEFGTYVTWDVDSGGSPMLAL